MARTSGESGDSATASGSQEQAQAYGREAALAGCDALIRQILESCAREGASKPPNIDDLKLTSPNPIPKGKNIRTFTKGADKAQVTKRFRRSRKFQVETYAPKYQYSYSTNRMEDRFCVWIHGACPWHEKSSGIMWVGVHGADSVCVVTRKEDLDTMRLCGNLNVISVDKIRALFRKTIISELEDLGDPSGELHQKFQKEVKKPFGVVSANPGPNNIEASNYDENKAIEFLKEKLKRDIDFDAYETTKTAIHAFQHLLRKKVKADEIEVSVMDPDCIYVVIGRERDSNVEELPVAQIEMYLDDTNGESGLSEVEILKQAIDPIIHSPEKATNEFGEIKNISPTANSRHRQTKLWRQGSL